MMSDLRSYSRKFLEEFIDMYRNCPCLWQVKSKQYSNRMMRNEAYGHLIEKLKEVEPNADREMVLKKINTLRTSFRRELKKVRGITPSGSSTENVYETHLWYYHLMEFLTNQETPRPGLSSMDSSEDLTDINETEKENMCNDVEINEITPSPKKASKRKQRHEAVQESTKEKLMNLACETLSQTSNTIDQYDTFAKNVANKLRNINNDQRIFSEKIISDVLFYGELGRLSLSTVKYFSNYLDSSSSDLTSRSSSVTSNTSTIFVSTPTTIQSDSLSQNENNITNNLQTYFSTSENI